VAVAKAIVDITVLHPDKSLSISPIRVDDTWDNMMPITKPEVHNVLHCHWRRTEPLSLATCTENWVKLGHVVFYM